jgi:prephenate dehydrogenase
MGARARIALVGAGAMGANHARVISESTTHWTIWLTAIGAAKRTRC